MKRYQNRATFDFTNKLLYIYIDVTSLECGYIYYSFINFCFRLYCTDIFEEAMLIGEKHYEVLESQEKLIWNNFRICFSVIVTKSAWYTNFDITDWYTGWYRYTGYNLKLHSSNRIK